MKKFRIILCMSVLSFALTACSNGSAEGEIMLDGDMGQQVQQTESYSTAQETQNWSDEMNAVRAAVAGKLGEVYLPSVPLDAEKLANLMGINSEMYDDYMGEVPDMTDQVDMLVVVKAREGQLENIEDAMNAYRDRLLSDDTQEPLNLGKLQASRIERIGQYICYVQLGGAVDMLMEQGEEAVLKYCLDQNEIAIDAIRSVVVK